MLHVKTSGTKPFSLRSQKYFESFLHVPHFAEPSYKKCMQTICQRTHFLGLSISPRSPQLHLTTLAETRHECPQRAQIDHCLPSGFLHCEFCLKPSHPKLYMSASKKGKEKKYYTRHNVRRVAEHPTPTASMLPNENLLPGLESPISAPHKPQRKDKATFWPPSC